MTIYILHMLSFLFAEVIPQICEMHYRDFGQFFKKFIILVRNLVDSLFLRARTYLSTYLVKACSNDARIAWKIAGTVLFLSSVDADVGRMV